MDKLKSSGTGATTRSSSPDVMLAIKRLREQSVRAASQLEGTFDGVSARTRAQLLRDAAAELDRALQAATPAAAAGAGTPVVTDSMAIAMMSAWFERDMSATHPSNVQRAVAAMTRGLACSEEHRVGRPASMEKVDVSGPVRAGDVFRYSQDGTRVATIMRTLPGGGAEIRVEGIVDGRKSLRVGGAKVRDIKTWPRVGKVVATDGLFPSALHLAQAGYPS